MYWGKLIFSIALCQATGVLGSLFTVQSIPTWYATLAKPSFAPPNFIFAPVWLVLYVLMGISFYLIIVKKSKQKTKAIQLFLIQLFLNALWSPVFFGLQSPLLGLIVIVALLVLIVVTTKQFYRIDKNAAYLLVPYLLWVSFATALNGAIWVLN